MRRQNGGGREHTAAAIYGHNPSVLFSFTAFGAGYLRWRSLPGPADDDEPVWKDLS